MLKGSNGSERRCEGCLSLMRGTKKISIRRIRCMVEKLGQTGLFACENMEDLMSLHFRESFYISALIV